MLVDLVDRGVGGAQFDHLGADLGNEAAVAGASGGGQFRGDACLGRDGLLHGAHQLAGRRKKGLAAERPAQVVFQAMAVEHGVHALLQALCRRFGREAKIEINHHFPGDHVGRTRSAMHVADLPAGGWKERIAVVPHGGGEFRQRGQGLVDGVSGQLRIGNVALDTTHAELAAQGAAPSVLDHVAGFLDGGGFAHDAVIEFFAASLELFHHDLGAVNGGTFLVAG